jgi:hypothetical protein
MLDAISLENHDEHVAITEGKYDIQRRFVGSFVTNAHKVANGTMTMEEFFNVPTAYSYNMSMFDSLLADKPEIRNAFVKSMIDYFATMDPKAISEKEITFIGGNPKDLSDTFFNKLKPELIFPQDRDYVRKLQFARNHIRLCEKGYSRLLIRGTSYIVDGKSHPVTDQVIDQALAYADDNGIFRCNYTISQLSKDIATGKLDYSAQTEGLMSEMRDVLKDLLQEKTQIEEYLQVMKDGHEM